MNDAGDAWIAQALLQTCNLRLRFPRETSDLRLREVRHILNHHYAGGEAAGVISAPILKQTRHTQQRKILDLHGFGTCGAKERSALLERAAQAVRISAKPVFLFRSLLQHLESRRIVVPGYSFMQDVVSQALAAERSRLTALLAGGLNEATTKALDALYSGTDSYAIAPLKRDPKDFSLRETRLEIARRQSLDALYRTVKTILPELGLSNDSIAYYAALVDYYTVQKLQQLSSDIVRLYILCFLSQRYRQINDNLIDGLIYQVRKVEGAARECMEQQVLAFEREGHESGRRVEQILNLFLDSGIDDSVSFGEVKRRAFGILERTKFERTARYIGAQGLDTAAIEWDFIASLAPSFKPLLRRLLVQLPLAAQSESDSLMEAVVFLRECFNKGRNFAHVDFERVPKAFIPQAVKAYIVQTDANGNLGIHYNATLLSQLLKYAEDRKDLDLADRIKRISPGSWKHINFYGEYAFRDTGEIVDLDQMIRQMIAHAEARKAEADTSTSTN